MATKTTKTTKTKSQVVKVTKKRKIAPVVEVGQSDVKTETKPEVTLATKQYIYDNMGRLSTIEIAKNCKLTEVEVEAIATSAELDINPADKEIGVTRIRRYQKHGNAIAMTASQSMLDDRERAKNLPTQDEVNEQFGKDFQKIQINPHIN